MAIAGKLLNLVRYGWPAATILSRYTTNNPKVNKFIEHAQVLGYSAHTIAHFLDDYKTRYTNPDKYKTAEELTFEEHKRQKREAPAELLGMLGTAGAVGAGLYGLYNLQQGQRAIQPSAILPPLRSPRKTIQQLPAKAAPAQLPYIKPSPGPKPTTPPTVPPSEPQAAGQPPTRDYSQSVNILKNLKVETQVATALQSGYNSATAAKILEKIVPKNKLMELQKFEGGLPRLVDDYINYLSEQPAKKAPEIPEEVRLRQEPITAEQLQPTSEETPPIAPKIPPMQPETLALQPEASRQRLEQKVRESTAGKLERIHPELRMFEERKYSTPDYFQPGETKQEFNDRKMIHDTLEKAAKHIMEGKTFVDFLPVEKAIGLSTAQDVLMFLAGAPNQYDDLFNEEEKDELRGTFVEDMTPFIGMLPTVAKGRIPFDAMALTENMIWNLLLTIEPKMQKIAPAFLKSKMSPGFRKDTSKIRRILAHTVHDILRGKKLTSELTDKIKTVADITKGMDVIINAAKQGKFEKMLKEMERLNEDYDYFSAVMDIELDNLLLTEAGKKVAIESEEEKRKGDIAFARAQTIKKKKSEGE